ncbi:MAG: 5-formyltetrahydrofolate cyclo-ligase [Butyrivibrio sp.]|nr:5-formyltetrahydrofolate cyclo-ligase [Butyrivibrio sp.]
MISKNEAREKVKKFRNNLSDRDAELMSGRIAGFITDMEEFKNAETVYIYKSINNEVDTDSIITAALEAGKTVALPRVSGGSMNFYRIASMEDLFFGYMGILEPSDNPYNLVNTDNGIAIVPGLAFDTSCNRVGYGGGYYDRFLEKHPSLITVGIAYNVQIFEDIETDENDIPLDMVVTDKGVHRRFAPL